MEVVQEVTDLLEREADLSSSETNKLFEAAIKEYDRLIDEKIIEPKGNILYPLEKNPQLIYQYNEAGK